ncbi:Uncharacterised protein [Klebsiella pneumoniae]|nr:Uncharacterised protein [Acinetobacter baumannii]SVJ79179.1 Uncharacterised protein [Klebsiella pneumoniae]
MRLPIFMACSSLATSSMGMAAYLAKIGPYFSWAMFISRSHCLSWVQPPS